MKFILKFSNLPLIPTEGPPAATAAKAYSIWTSLPEGLVTGRGEKTTNNIYII